MYMINLNLRKNFFIAIDGVGNAAKMQQQKTRRFGSTKDKDKITPILISVPEHLHLEHNMMIKVDKAITDLVKKC